MSWLAIVVGLVGIGWFAGWLLLRLVRLMRQVRLVDFGATVLHFLVNGKKSISAFTPTTSNPINFSEQILREIQ